jgi:hypothetical protein
VAVRRLHDPLPTSAGDAVQLAFRFSATAVRRAGHSIVLLGERFEIPPHTDVGPAQGVRLVDPLPVDVEIEDVSTFTRAVGDDEIPIVFVISSHVAAEIDTLYAGDAPFPKLAATRLPLPNPMWHPSLRRRFVTEPVVRILPVPQSW